MSNTHVVLTRLNKDQFEKLLKICERAGKSPWSMTKQLLLELIEKEGGKIESSIDGRVEEDHRGKSKTSGGETKLITFVKS